MKLTGHEVFTAGMTLRALGAEKLPVKAKYWINRMNAKLKDELENLEKSRIDIMVKHGATDTLPVPKENVTACNNEAKDFFDQVLEIDCPTIKLSLLGEGEIATDLTPLDRFIVDEENEKPADLRAVA